MTIYQKLCCWLTGSKQVLKKFINILLKTYLLCNNIFQTKISMNLSSSDSQDEDPFYKKYIKLQKIAEGTYGIVWKGKKVQTGQLVALKIFKNMSHEGLPVSAVRQIHILKKLNTPYILQPIQLNIKQKSVCMVSQWKELTLQNLIKSSGPYNSKLIIKQIIKAVDSIHDNYIMHRDLKPANIVLDNGQGNQLKIIDLGMAKQIKWNKNIKMTNQVGTLYYRAPELLQGSTLYTKSIDIWAIGCIFYELLTKQILFKGQTELNQIITIYEDISTEEQRKQLINKHKEEIKNIEGKNWNRIKQNLQKILPSIQKQLDLLKRILLIDGSKRLSCKQMLLHPYFQN